jgi:endo-1,4-beta-xylanase
MKTVVLLALSLIASGALAAESPSIPLWPKDAPGSEGKSEPEKVITSNSGERQVSCVHAPSITPFLPAKEKASGACILVIPGGGHRILCVDHEGAYIAQWLADHGIAAFVLKHRLAREPGSTYTIEEHALADTQRALRLIRSRAGEWGIDGAKLGAIGFSAGGELVCFAGLRATGPKAGAADPIDRQDDHIAFQGFVYPGVSRNIVPEKDSPPAFFLCGEKDRQDISEGLPEAYLRYKRAGISAELHVYANVGHGFGYRPTISGPIASWPDRFFEWLTARGMIPAKPL